MDGLRSELRRAENLIGRDVQDAKLALVREGASDRPRRTHYLGGSGSGGGPGAFLI